jgi:hypothetical protein
MMRPESMRDLPALVPEVDDPRWERWTGPLAAFLARPRTWDQLRAWAADNAVSQVLLKHLLAWLSYNLRIDGDGKVWRPRAPAEPIAEAA